MTITDTSFWIAFLDEGDALHADALEISKKKPEQKILGVPLAVIFETYNLLQKKKLKKEMRVFFDLLKNTDMIDIVHHPNAEEIETTQNIFLDQKGSLSFTDVGVIQCAIIMRANEIMTFDSKMKKYYHRMKSFHDAQNSDTNG